MSNALAIPSKLSAMSDAELFAVVERGLRDTADAMMNLAMAVSELESRGRDLSGLRIPLLKHLRMIATGQLLPGAIIAFASMPTHIEAIAELPVAEQQRLIDGGKVSIADNEGEAEMPLARIPARTVRKVISAGHIRTPREQRLAQVEKRQAKPEEPKVRKFTPKPDQERKGLMIGAMFVPYADLLKAMAELSGPKLVQLDRTLPDTETITVIVTAEEKAKLKAAEKRRGVGEWHIVREALQAVGLI